MLKILSPYGADAAQWQSYFDRLTLYEKDVHFTPAYARAQAHLGEPYAAIGVYGRDFVIQPFLLHTADRRKDISSLYGYGGPVPSNSGLNDFTIEFAIWCEKNDILCEYCRLGPFLRLRQCGLMEAAGVKVDKIRDVVIVDTVGDSGKLIHNFSRNRQRGIAAARDRGFLVRPGKDWHLFSTMYDESLQRLKAKDNWYYADKIWQAYVEGLGPEYCTLFGATTDYADVAMLLVIHGYGKAYAHFLANDTKEANDLLYYEAMRYCCEMGCEVFHLGGGLTDKQDDSLLAYKMGFGKRLAPVYAYKRVFNEPGYAAACEGLEPTSFFPAYKAPAHSSQAHQA